jgi:hypothetical protein
MFLIDGHNLLHMVLKSEENAGATTDLELCRVLSRYMTQVGRPGVIIFDGSGPPDKSGFDYIANLEILFAGPGADADTVIEDKICASTAPKRMTVVSNDRRLRRAARARKCTSMKTEVFWADILKELCRKRPESEPAAKRFGLSDSETDQWLDAFGI